MPRTAWLGRESWPQVPRELSVVVGGHWASPWRCIQCESLGPLGAYRKTTRLVWPPRKLYGDQGLQSFLGRGIFGAQNKTVPGKPDKLVPLAAFILLGEPGTRLKGGGGGAGGAGG